MKTRRWIGEWLSRSLLFGCVINSCVPLKAAQKYGATTQFDVVSIRPLGSTHIVAATAGEVVHGPIIRPCTYLADRVMCQLTLQGLIDEAYQVKDFQIVGSSSLKDEVFVVQATMPLNTPKDVARSMLRQMLTERFGLKIHHEEREIPVDALVVGKHGAKLQPASEPSEQEVTSTNSSSGSMRGRMIFGPGHFVANGYPLDALVNIMETRTGDNLPIVNMTGLSGTYNFDVHWQPDSDSGDLQMGRDTSFVDAVQEQLGLRLEKRKAPYDVLIVDKVELKPSEN